METPFVIFQVFVNIYSRFTLGIYIGYVGFCKHFFQEIPNMINALPSVTFFVDSGKPVKLVPCQE